VNTRTDGQPALTRALRVGFVGLVIVAAIIANVVSAADPHAGEGRTPFVTTFAGSRNHIEAVLVGGDGQAFAAIAEDPLLQRPELVPGQGEFAYRFQRPLWGYLAWAGSVGQAPLVGWVLAVMTVLAAGACCAVVALLLMRRGESPWWALAVLAAGLESLSQLTPELFGLALLGGALLLPRSRRGVAIGLCCAAALTRESLLVGVAAWALYELVHSTGAWRDRVRAVLPFAIPFVCFGAWVVVLRARAGTWVWDQPHDRMTAPFVGLRQAFDPMSGRITVGVTVAIAICVLCLWTARGDVLSWIALAFAAFGTLFAAQVWTGAGYERTLLPLYVFGGIAALAGARRRTSPASTSVPRDLQTVG